MFLACNAFAAPRAANKTTQGLLDVPASKNLYFSINMVDLAKSSGNASLDFFVNDRVSLNLNLRSSSDNETVKLKNGQKSAEKLSVDRSAYGMGGSLWLWSPQAEKNILVTPYLAFGQKKYALETENVSGIGLKVTGMFRINNQLRAEAGARGDSLDDSAFKAGVYGGIGYLF